MLALCLMLLGTYYTLPIMLALCLMLLGTYYAQNYAGIIGRSLLHLHFHFNSNSSIPTYYINNNEIYAEKMKQRFRGHF